MKKILVTTLFSFMPLIASCSTVSSEKSLFSSSMQYYSDAELLHLLFEGGRDMGWSAKRWDAFNRDVLREIDRRKLITANEAVRLRKIARIRSYLSRNAAQNFWKISDFRVLFHYEDIEPYLADGYSVEEGRVQCNHDLFGNNIYDYKAIKYEEKIGIDNKYRTYKLNIRFFIDEKGTRFADSTENYNGYTYIYGGDFSFCRKN